MKLLLIKIFPNSNNFLSKELHDEKPIFSTTAAAVETLGCADSADYYLAGTCKIWLALYKSITCAFRCLEQKFTALLITHDIEKAVTLAVRIVMLEDGRVTMDTRVSLPRPRKRNNQKFLTLAEEVLERVMGDEADLIKGTEDEVEELVHA